MLVVSTSKKCCLEKTLKSEKAPCFASSTRTGFGQQKVCFGKLGFVSVHLGVKPFVCQNELSLRLTKSSFCKLVLSRGGGAKFRQAGFVAKWCQILASSFRQAVLASLFRQACFGKLFRFVRAGLPNKKVACCS
jgi:hypothetical protein